MDEKISALTVYRLQPGTHYRIAQRFTDHYGGAFEPGTDLTFLERHFLPYEGGHTLRFEEATIYLSENVPGEDAILTAFDHYFAEVT